MANRVIPSTSGGSKISPMAGVTPPGGVLEKEWTGCSLQEGCLSLGRILKSFSAPISEEHAWAVIHQVGDIHQRSSEK